MEHSLVRLLFLIPRILAWKAFPPLFLYLWLFSCIIASSSSPRPGEVPLQGPSAPCATLGHRRYPCGLQLSVSHPAVSSCGQGCCVIQIGISSSYHCTWHRAGLQSCLLNCMKLWSSWGKYHDIQNKTLALKVRQH